MLNWFKQLGGLLGAGIAAACCLGVPPVLAALGAAGLGFLIRDAYLFPIFVAFVALALWYLYRSARSHGSLAPFWVGVTGASVGAAALWLMVTGLFLQPWAVYVGLGTFVAGSLWDLINARRRPACEPARDVPARPQTGAAAEPDLGRRAVNGAAISVAAAAAFYGMYRSVEAFVPATEVGQIACWGINSCKGQTACTTAFNACSGQNECRGRGYLHVSEKECYSKGGVPLENSPGDPAKG